MLTPLGIRGGPITCTKLALKLVDTVVRKRPLYAQLIVTRRCNLSCGYCFEYDNKSPPVPTETVKQRIDALHRLGTFHICKRGCGVMCNYRASALDNNPIRTLATVVKNLALLPVAAARR